MKIARIEVYSVTLPYAGGTYRLSGGRSFTAFAAVFTRVMTECGLEGWGESTPFGSTYIAAHAGGVKAGLAELAPALIGMDPRHHDRIYDAMDAALVGHAHAKTPLDVACWDIAGKAAGLPVCDLLGGRVPGAVPLISSIGSDDPQAMRENVASHRELGFLGHSVKVGSAEAEGGPMLDAERVQACLADRRPGEWFLVDANGGMSPEQALRFLALLPKGLDFTFEAPCASWRETLSLRKRCHVPLLLDELVQSDADIAQAVASDACDGVGLKISKQGGLTPTRRQRDMARAAGLVMSVQDTTGSDIAFAAVLHMAQSTPRHVLRCALDTRSMVSLTTAAFDAPVQGGGAQAPAIPGLGVMPDMSIMGAPIAIYEDTP
ncbi:mandelate racemase/muconate lactonizing enzyme family protein [Aliisedimentitalea scapharcae]|uniref:Mandelate racemase/muconate lactonizing enzyme family protein n=1 Tax=Aliisedimentitalea scapharcae TaxID=1524259 RepID=A0ABZ2XQM4_9RHOB